MLYTCEKIVMSDGSENFFHRWLPDGEAQFIVLLSHGMTEHAARYADFGSFLAAQHIALYAEDHRGHGRTAQNARDRGTGDFGQLADKNGFFRVVDDIKEEAELLHKQYPGKKLFLFGHSFGSFIAQCFIEKYAGLIDGAILCGTAGPRAIVHVGKAMAGIIRMCKGGKHISPLLEHLSFSSYNDNWLTRDEAVIKKYAEDPWSGFHCCVGFYHDMFSGLCYTHASRHLRRIPHRLPIFLIAGSDDPVGSYGETVSKLSSIYKANGVQDVLLKLYPGARHELLNEINRDEVKADILSWLLRHAPPPLLKQE